MLAVLDDSVAARLLRDDLLRSWGFNEETAPDVVLELVGSRRDVGLYPVTDVADSALRELGLRAVRLRVHDELAVRAALAGGVGAASLDRVGGAATS